MKGLAKQVVIGALVALLAAAGSAYVQVWVLSAKLEQIQHRVDQIEAELWDALNDHAQDEAKK